MNKRIKEAVEIANAYRREHNGELPVLVVAHGREAEPEVFIGKFRKDERGKGAKTRSDQQIFVSVMRFIFAQRGVTSYEVIAKPEIKNAELQLTQNILSIFTVDEVGSECEFFEIEDDELIPCYTDMSVGSWFSQLLPTSFSIELDYKTAGRMERYAEACRYYPPVVEVSEAVAFEDTLEAHLDSLALIM